jgi:FtsP/CotA-like multicopper oxidase with cupredoxin domain
MKRLGDRPSSEWHRANGKSSKEGSNLRFVRLLCFLAFALAIGFASPASATSSAGGCQRPDSGAQATAPADLYSSGGALNVTLNYETSLDAFDRTRFCFVTPEGQESPTLHVFPGDTLNITLDNQLPSVPGGAADEMAVGPDIWNCGWPNMTAASVNLHFHGTNTRPICHGDEVIHTLVNAGDVYTYSVTFPTDEPPGLYWYHPHVHGLSDAAVQGGATGAIVVEGIENLQPEVSGLPERILLIRDQRLARGPPPDGKADASPVQVAAVPSWDLTLNYVPIEYPDYVPAVIGVNPGEKEFWRVVNSSADTIVDLVLNYDGVAQPLEIVALDGVPTGSHDGSGVGTPITKTHVLLPPAGRAEFIMTSPSTAVKTAIFKTRAIDTGPSGDSDVARPLAVLSASRSATVALPSIPKPTRGPGPRRFDGIDAAPIHARRKLHFSEKPLVATGDIGQDFYITVDGETPKSFKAANPPAIITRQGSVEEWTIENRTLEVHEFHIHQIHFQLRARDGVAVPSEERQFFDTIQVPYWSGEGPYPSITIALDFRGDITGDFVYHCHILDHEDHGMMAIIRVLPSSPPR